MSTINIIAPMPNADLYIALTEKEVVVLKKLLNLDMGAIGFNTNDQKLLFSIRKTLMDAK